MAVSSVQAPAGSLKYSPARMSVTGAKVSRRQNSTGAPRACPIANPTSAPKLYGDLADFMKVHFLDAGDHITTDGVDGIHFTEENNLVLGRAIAEKVGEILAARIAA